MNNHSYHKIEQSFEAHLQQIVQPSFTTRNRLLNQIALQHEELCSKTGADDAWQRFGKTLVPGGRNHRFVQSGVIRAAVRQGRQPEWERFAQQANDDEPFSERNVVLQREVAKQNYYGDDSKPPAPGDKVEGLYNGDVIDALNDLITKGELDEPQTAYVKTLIRAFSKQLRGKQEKIETRDAQLKKAEEHKADLRAQNTTIERVLAIAPPKGAEAAPNGTAHYTNGASPNTNGTSR